MIAAQQIASNPGWATAWDRAWLEPSLGELLTDEIAADVMLADHVTIEDIWCVVSSARRQLQTAGNRIAPPVARNGAATEENDGAPINVAALFDRASLAEHGLRHDQIAGLQAIGGTEVEEVDWMLAHVGLATEALPLPVCADLYLNCAGCTERRRCRKWFAIGHADDGYRMFCPNAPMFDRMRQVQRWRGAPPPWAKIPDADG